jgi:hypothetical protein
VVLVDAAEPAGQPGRLAERDPALVPLEAAAVGHGMGLGICCGPGGPAARQARQCAC